MFWYLFVSAYFLSKSGTVLIVDHCEESHSFFTSTHHLMYHRIVWHSVTDKQNYTSCYCVDVRNLPPCILIYLCWSPKSRQTGAQKNC